MKKFTPILLLSFLIIVACAKQDDSSKEEVSTELTESSVSTMSTTTYVDEEYGFSFEYPSDWVQSDKADFQVQFKRFDELNESKSALGVWSGPNITHGLEGVGEVCDKTTIKIAGQNVEMETRCGKVDFDTNEEIMPDFRLITLFFTNDNIEYGLEFSMEDPTVYDDEESVLNVVISSFSFTD